VVGDRERRFELSLENVSMALREDRANQEVMNLSRFGKLDLYQVNLRNDGLQPVLRARDGATVRIRKVSSVPANPSPYLFEEIDLVEQP
jgi:hypothetical protein